MDDFKMIYKLIRPVFPWMKSNLSIILILPAIFGGLWQIIELSNISFSFIRFFSVSQVAPDGLLLLLVILLFVASGGFVYLVHYWLISLGTPQLDNGDIKVSAKPNIFLGFILMICYCSFLTLALYSFYYFSMDMDSLFTLIILVPVTMILMYFSMGAFIFANLHLIHLPKLSKIFRNTFWLMIGVLFFMFLIFASQLHSIFTLPYNLINMEVVKQKIEEDNPNMKLEILYLNDKYIFVKMYGFVQVNHKPKQDILRVYKFDELLDSNLKGYTFPEDFEPRYFDTDRYHKKLPAVYVIKNGRRVYVK